MVLIMLWSASQTREMHMYLITACHPEAIRIQTFKYKTIKEAEADCKKYGWVIQAVQKISK